MDESAGASVPGSDAELLNRIRSGDPGAGNVLRARHAAAARRLAGHLVPGSAAADETVAVAFRQVFDAIVRGGGPSDAFRPYLLSAVRRIARDNVAGLVSQMPADEQHFPDPGQPLLDPASGWERSAVVEAFLALPERWRAVLWHVEIERTAAADVAPLLGLDAAGVAEIAGWARDGLDREYRQIQEAGAGRDQGWPDGLDVPDALRREVAPVFLGEAARSYLTEPARPAGPRRAHKAPARGGVALAWLTGPVRHSSRPQRTAAAGAGALLAVAGLAVYLLTSNPATAPESATSHQAATQGSGTPTSPGLAATVVPDPGQPASASPGSASPAQTPGNFGGSPGSAAPLPSPAPPGAAPSAQPTQPTSVPTSVPISRPTEPPPAQGPTGPGPARVTAQVSVTEQGSSHLAGVAFTVTDSGPVATSDLTVSISLPPGTAMTGQSQSGRPHGSPAQWSANGWTCQEVSAGVSCAHGPLAPAAQAGGLLVVRVRGSTACGQHVTVLVSAGAATASAQSPGTIACHQSGAGAAMADASQPGASQSDVPQSGAPWSGSWPGLQQPGGLWPGWPYPGQ